MIIEAGVALSNPSNHLMSSPRQEKTQRWFGTKKGISCFIYFYIWTRINIKKETVGEVLYIQFSIAHVIQPTIPIFG